MIEGRGNINTWQSGMHEHRVTECLHKETAAKTESAGAGNKTEAAKEQPVQKQEEVSVKEALIGGLRSLYTKTTGLLGRIWYDGQGSTENVPHDPVTDSRADTAVLAGTQATGNAAEAVPPLTAVNALAAGMVKPAEAERSLSGEEALAEKGGRKVSSVEGAVSGGLRKEQGGIRKFLKQFGEMAFGRGRLWRKKSAAEAAVKESAVDTELRMGENSYLLDSYNRSGEYSTLSKDRSQEGRFKAKG